MSDILSNPGHSPENIVRIKGSPIKLFQVLELAVTNASQAIEAKVDGRVEVEYGKKTIQQLGEEEGSHFSQKGYNGGLYKSF